jgi:hypothetical protein
MSRRYFSWMLVAALAGLAAACGGTKATKVGAPVTVTKPTALEAIVAAPQSFEGQMVRVEGVVKAACQGMGCWVEVQDAKGATFIAKSLDESILVPKDCAGRKVVVQGVVTALPGEHQDHPEPTDHVCPRPEYVLATQGIELR